MTGYDDVRTHLEPLGRARCFRRGAAKHFAGGVWQLSRSLVWYWIHWRIESNRVSSLARLTLLRLVVFRQRKETVALEPPAVGEAANVVETPNVELRGATKERHS